jgi:hypothetical protein
MLWENAETVSAVGLELYTLLAQTQPELNSQIM